MSPTDYPEFVELLDHIIRESGDEPHETVADPNNTDVAADWLDDHGFSSHAISVRQGLSLVQPYNPAISPRTVLIPGSVSQLNAYRIYFYTIVGCVSFFHSCGSPEELVEVYDGLLAEREMCRKART